MAQEHLLEFKKISKKFAGTLALNEISFGIKQGEVHCLVGENGAGKSTLIKILTGAYSLDKGEITLEGNKVDISSPQKAKELGIAVVYQDVNVVNQLSIADNIMLGREHRAMGFIDQKKNIAEIIPYLERIKLSIDPNTLLSDLSTAQKQMVMIAKAIALQAKIIILDEPTAMLSENEVKILFEIIQILKSSGVTIIYISHRLNELFEIGDSVTILKDGVHVSTSNLADMTIDEIVVRMVGRELTKAFPPKTRSIGSKLLEVLNLSNSKINNISFELHEGEILGIAGLVGSGRTEILRAIIGADPIDSGDIILKGQKIYIKNPSDAVNHKICLIPEDRRHQGIIKVLSVKDNMSLIYAKLTQRMGFIRHNLIKQTTDRFIQDFQIKTSSANKQIGFLSGGNQQKVVLAKWISINPQIILLDEPTQGIDVGAKSEIFDLIDRLARQGVGVIMVSSDLLEVIHMSDTIMVMRNGEITKTMPGLHATEEKVISYAMGVEQ
jgi:ABC-type sugar transport system ATPase subunit